MLPESAAGSTSIMVSSFPSPSELESWKDEAAEKDMEVHKRPITPVLHFQVRDVIYH